MVVFPNCKINIGLQVLQKRSDGFHNIETVFYPVPLKDALEIISLPAAQAPSLHVYGLPVEGHAADNICIKAWQLLKKDFPALPAVQVHLIKHIPMGAGLGGGSSDGAFMLQLLNKTFALGLSDRQLSAYALLLGSDCPFFLVNRPCYATGRGELLQPLPLHLAGYQLALSNPGIHIDTGWAFSQLPVNDSLIKSDLKQAILQPVETWQHHLLNSFEQPVFEKYPPIRALKENFYRLGAVYASMSGSGSTVFGLFKKEPALAERLGAAYTVMGL